MPGHYSEYGYLCHLFLYQYCCDYPTRNIFLISLKMSCIFETAVGLQRFFIAHIDLESAVCREHCFVHIITVCSCHFEAFLVKQINISQTLLFYTKIVCLAVCSSS